MIYRLFVNMETTDNTGTIDMLSDGEEGVFIVSRDGEQQVGSKNSEFTYVPMNAGEWKAACISFLEDVVKVRYHTSKKAERFESLVASAVCETHADIDQFFDMYLSLIDEYPEIQHFYYLKGGGDDFLYPLCRFLERAQESALLHTYDSERSLYYLKRIIEYLPKYDTSQLRFPEPVVSLFRPKKVQGDGYVFYLHEKKPNGRGSYGIDMQTMDSVGDWDDYDAEQTVFARELIRLLGISAREQAIAPLLDILKECSFFDLRQDVGTVLSAIDGSRAAQEILARIQDVQFQKQIIEDPAAAWYHQDLLRLLYQLNIGDLTISSRAIEYLDRHVRLDTDVEGVARQVSKTGMFGVFASDTHELTHVALPSADVPDWNRVQELVVQHIVANPAPVGTPEYEAQQELLQVFRLQYYQVLTQMEAPLVAVHLSTLPLREQAQVVSLFTKLTDGERYQVEVFCHKYGVTGVRLCALVESGNITFEQMLSFPHVCEHPGDMYTLMNSYARLEEKIDTLRHADVDGSVVYQYGPCALAEERLRQSIARFALRREKSVSTEHIHQLFDQLNVDVLLMSSLVRALRTESTVEAASFVGALDCTVRSATDLSAETKDALRTMMVRNYLDEFGEPRPYGSEVAIPSLDASFDDSRNTFFVLYQEKEPVSFVRFEDRGDHYYGGSFNVSREAQSSGIGEIFLAQTLDRMDMEQKPIRAIAEVDKPIGARYVNQFGFVVTGLEQNKNGTGVDVFHIERSAQYIAARHAPESSTITVDITDVAEFERHIHQGYVGTLIERDASGRIMLQMKAVPAEPQVSKAA